MAKTMKTIRISEEVWNEMVKQGQGKFGETEDVVLRRLLKLDQIPVAENNAQLRWKQRRATVRMTQEVIGNKLKLQFDTGQKFEKTLPARNDRPGIRNIRDAAVTFVRENGGTKGQEHAAIRALTHRGYHVAKVDVSEFV